MLRTAVLALGAATFFGFGPASFAGAAGQAPVDGAMLARRLRAGSVTLPGGSVVRGDVQLERTANYVLTCRRCRFEGSLLAARNSTVGTLELDDSEITGAVRLSGVTLQGDLRAPRTTIAGVLDLRGSKIKGLVDMSGAHFDSPVLASQLTRFGTIGHPRTATTFGKGIDLRLARFADVATFQGATLNGPARFGLSAFAGDAVFASVVANGSVGFGRASFERSADFRNAMFFSQAGDASCPSPVGNASFSSPAAFDAAQFKGHADFSGAMFAYFSFAQARFAENARFVAAQFHRFAFGVQPQASFKDVEVGGDLNFSFARIETPIDFESLDVDKTLSFSGARTSSACDPEVRNGLSFSHLSAGALLMPIQFVRDTVESGDDQRLVLAMIESSAKARGDLGTANDAHYESQVIKSRSYWLPWHVLDFVFYRTFAGYFVRPFNPLLTLLALAAAMSLYRATRAVWRSSARVAGAGVRIASSWPRLFLQTLLLILPERWVRKPDEEAEPAAKPGARAGSRPIIHGLEVFTYRVLVACALIGLANSNPTLRQMLDGIH